MTFKTCCQDTFCHGCELHLVFCELGTEVAVAAVPVEHGKKELFRLLTEKLMRAHFILVAFLKRVRVETPQAGEGVFDGELRSRKPYFVWLARQR